MIPIKRNNQVGVTRTYGIEGKVDVKWECGHMWRHNMISATLTMTHILRIFVSRQVSLMVLLCDNCLKYLF